MKSTPHTQLLWRLITATQSNTHVYSYLQQTTSNKQHSSRTLASIRRTIYHFQWCHLACSVLTNYLIKCWIIVVFTLWEYTSAKILSKWNYLITGHIFGNDVCKTLATLFEPQCIDIVIDIVLQRYWSPQRTRRKCISQKYRNSSHNIIIYQICHLLPCCLLALEIQTYSVLASLLPLQYNANNITRKC